MVKNVGGTVTPTSHLFEKRGRIILEAEKEGIDEEKVMERVLEAGALDMDVEEDQTSLSVYTEPSQTASIGQSLARLLGLKLRSYEIVWMARPEFRVQVERSGIETQPNLEEIISTFFRSTPHMCC